MIKRSHCQSSNFKGNAIQAKWKWDLILAKWDKAWTTCNCHCITSFKQVYLLFHANESLLAKHGSPPTKLAGVIWHIERASLLKANVTTYQYKLFFDLIYF